jgi:hypothetical protein
MSACSESVVHFGPVWGRPVAVSMALCDSTRQPAGSGRTMSRSLKMITCDKCEQMIQDIVNAAAAKEAQS